MDRCQLRNLADRLRLMRRRVLSALAATLLALTAAQVSVLTLSETTAGASVTDHAVFKVMCGINTTGVATAVTPFTHLTVTVFGAPNGPITGEIQYGPELPTITRVYQGNSPDPVPLGQQTVSGYGPDVRFTWTDASGTHSTTYVVTTCNEYQFGVTRTHSKTVDKWPHLSYVGIAADEAPTGPSPQDGGYDLVTTTGKTFNFGTAATNSEPDVPLTGGVVGVTSSLHGSSGFTFNQTFNWVVSSNGSVFALNGLAPDYGTATKISLAAPIVGIAALPTSRGYWLVGADGGVFSFGAAKFYGSIPALGIKLRAPIVGVASTPDGKGYYLVAADGGVFTFGDARFRGSMGGTQLAKPVVGMAVDPTTGGYWLAAADGGVFSFDAPYDGSLPGEHITPAKPVVGMAATPFGDGYWLAGADGGVFTFGSAPFDGSAVPDVLPTRPDPITS